MLFNSQRQSSTHGSSSPNNDFSTISDKKNNYRASVPLCIYREIVQDWEATKAELESLKDKNRQLMSQNEELREEIAKILTSAHNLEQIRQKCQETLDFSPVPQHQRETPSQQENTSPIPPNLDNPGDNSVNPEYVMEVDSHSLPSSHSSKRSEINVFGLILAIVFIILGCTAASFLVAKFIIKNNHSSYN
jgi:hypothetical protein